MPMHTNMAAVNIPTLKQTRCQAGNGGICGRAAAAGTVEADAMVSVLDTHNRRSTNATMYVFGFKFVKTATLVL